MPLFSLNHLLQLFFHHTLCPRGPGEEILCKPIPQKKKIGKEEDKNICKIPFRIHLLLLRDEFHVFIISLAVWLCL